MVHRVAIVFDNRIRPETTGFYCRRALERFVEVEHVLPTELDSLPAHVFDLCLVVDDGMDYVIPRTLRPAAFWAIDTHLNFNVLAERSGQFDLVFAAQQDGAQRLSDVLSRDVTWLPLACDPSIHTRHDLPKRFDVSFVGNIVGRQRAELLEQLTARYAASFCGNCYFEEMARRYSESRSVFNRSVGDDINMRVFEALACGSLLLTNGLPGTGQSELFQDGRHLVTYDNADELFDKLDWYLAHEAEREKIAAAGRREAISRHTYNDRMHLVLQKAARAAQVPVLNSPCLAQTKVRQCYEFERAEVLALIPPSARRVLDLGCGAGCLGASLKERQPVHVTGIELHAGMAAAARDRLDEVVVGNIESERLNFPDGQFDCIVCADVLEHLEHPRHVLSRLRGWLSEDGVLVASVPNIQHHSIIKGLLDGDFSYEPAGLLDEDHVYFFTWNEIQTSFSAAGFQIDQVQTVVTPSHREWCNTGRPAGIDVHGLRIATASPADAEPFHVYQYLVSARASKDCIDTAQTTDRDETHRRDGQISFAADPCLRTSLPDESQRVLFVGAEQSAVHDFRPGSMDVARWNASEARLESPDCETRYDAVLIDSLSDFRTPLPLLKSLQASIRSNGRVFSTACNARHRERVARLLEGDWAEWHCWLLLCAQFDL